MLLVAIVVLLIVLLRTAIEGFHGVWQNQSYNYNELRKIVVGVSEQVGQTNGKIDGFIPWAKLIRQKVENLENAKEDDKDNDGLVSSNGRIKF